MDITASQRHLRMSPRKVRLVARSIHGLPVHEATYALKHLAKAASVPLEKLLRSAIANAKENHKLSEASLKVKQLIVNEAPTLKRYRPRAYGRSAMIRKRASHVTLVLHAEEEKSASAKASAGKTETPKPKKKEGERHGP
jgi:large subunit ribosomal protein L22